MTSADEDVAELKQMFEELDALAVDDDTFILMLTRRFAEYLNKRSRLPDEFKKFLTQ